MKSILNSLNIISLIFSLSAIFACVNKKAFKEKETVDLGQNVTHNVRRVDSVFLHFEKNWKKFISPAVELTMPVQDNDRNEDWQPLIISDCVFVQEIGAPVPQVEITWQEPINQQENVRFDLALQTEGFQRNYYTTVFPVEKTKRFNIPMRSEFVKDTAATLLVGPAMFAKVIDYQSSVIRGIPADSNQQSINKNYKPEQGTGFTKKTLRLSELGSGLSYRIRMCAFNNEVWMPTREVIFSTPICPVDIK